MSCGWRGGVISLACALLLAGCAGTGPHYSGIGSRSFQTPQPIGDDDPGRMKAIAEVLGSGAKRGGRQVASLARNSTGRVMNLANRGKGSAAAATEYPFEVPARIGQVSNSGFMWPAYGTVSRGYSKRSGHRGIDVLAPTGTPVYAARNGRVLYSGRKFSGFGNVVILDHGGGLATIYAHNSRNLVKEDELVSCGQQIAEVGQTGRATAPHCHFEIRQDGEALDPRPLLP